MISEASIPVSSEAHSGVLAKCPSVPKKYFLNNSNIKRFSSMVVMNRVKENLSVPLN